MQSDPLKSISTKKNILKQTSYSYL